MDGASLRLSCERSQLGEMEQGVYRPLNVEYARSQKHRAGLEEEIKIMSTSLVTLEVAAVQATLSRMQDLAQASDKSLRGERTAEVAKEVFAIPELLENILFFLPNRALLDAYRITRHFRDTIQRSLKLQNKLGLRAQFDTRPYSTIGCSSCLHLTVDVVNVDVLNYREDDHKDQRIRTSLHAKKHITKLGPRSSSMLICQPPVRRLEVWASCCSMPWVPTATPTEMLVAAEGSVGITIGDINEMVKRVRQQHRQCPEADFDDHSKVDGSVEVWVDFRGSIEVDATTPLMMELVAARRECQKKAAARKDELKAYV